MPVNLTYKRKQQRRQLPTKAIFLWILFTSLLFTGLLFVSRLHIFLRTHNNKVRKTTPSLRETMEKESALLSLPPPIREAAQLIWDFHHVKTPLQKSDVILALGTNDIRVAERAAELYLQGYAPLLVFSGGVGALTRGMFGGVSEAARFKEVAVKAGVPPEAILCEEASTNTGENIRFTQALLLARQQGIPPPTSILLVQKPFMERRTLATFMKQWAPPLPTFSVTSPQIPLAQYPMEGVNRMGLSDVLETMCGDLQRIAVYPALGFQTWQDIPQGVWEALKLLIREGVSGPQLMLVPGASPGSREPGDYQGLGEDHPPPKGEQ